MAKNKKNDVGKQPTNEEQMQRRQSAPKPTAEDELMRMGQQVDPMQMGMQQMQDPMMQGRDASGAIDAFVALEQPIGREAIQKATLTLQKYKEGKANLERRIVDNEQWYKMRHWECMRKGQVSEVQPTSGWLFNSIANKHADAMDSFPSPNVLPREEGDKAEAEMLTSILPVVLDQNDFEKVYSDVWNYKLKSGTGVYGIFWNSEKLNSLGDIDIQRVDMINLFWEPGVMDIQESRNLFHVAMMDNDLLISQYPQLQGKLGRATIDIAKYVFDDTVDVSEKTIVVDWYYKKKVNGKQVLHYCKYVNDEVLFATENDPQYVERGYYDHGKYPFLFDPLFLVEGTPAGFGYVDVAKSAQEYIDRGNQAILQNMLANARPRHFIRNDGSVNEQEYADMTKDFVHVDGNLGQDSILPISGKPLSAIYVQILDEKINELKETTGNRDVSTGGTGGVTAGSAIAAMQEAGSKLSRDSSRQAYRVFRDLCLMVIELIRQFYDMPRCFRIMGQDGMQRFVMYSNAGIAPQPQGMEFGVDMGMRIPLFDIEVSAQKQSPYSKMSQNELALQFYSAGFFDPQRADQALACLDMMDFPRKEFIMKKIQQNGGMMQQMMMMAQMLDQATGAGGQFTAGLAQQFGMPMPQGAPQQGDGRQPSAGDTEERKENALNRKARARVADSTSPK